MPPEASTSWPSSGEPRPDRRHHHRRRDGHLPEHDTGTTLTYTWAVTSADGGTIAPTTGASTTYTPPTLAAGDAARTIVITVTVSDGATR